MDQVKKISWKLSTGANKYILKINDCNFIVRQENLTEIYQESYNF